MKTKLKLLTLTTLLTWSTISLAAVLVGQWTDGTSRYCKYSDGTVLEMSFGSTCSSTN